MVILFNVENYIKGPIKFKSQAKWFLICNDIPDVPSDDDGTWRRLTVINFPSKFIPRSEMTGRDFEYERINNMNDKLEELKEPFIWLLLEYFKEFKELMKSTGLMNLLKLLRQQIMNVRKIIQLNNLLMIELYIVQINQINLILLKFIMYLEVI